ncbi:MAG: AraC family transcriptional regulator [Pseudomonadota bacterium]
MMKVDQAPIDFIDAAVPEIVFCRASTAGRGILLDIGDGPTEVPHVGGEFTVTPALTTPRTRVLDQHVITMLTLPTNKLCPSMIHSGLSGDASVFSRFLGRMGYAPLASRLMDRMWEVLQSPGCIDQLLFDGLTLQFLAEMAGATDLQPLGGARPEDGRIARVIDYVEAHFGDSLDISTLAGVACLSPAHFSRVFKETVGTPVWAYVQERRCVRAKEILLGTSLPLIEVAFRCGFSSQAHFTRAISKHFGATPGHIRDASR